MSGGAAAQTMRASAVRLNHRWRRFAGANALKKIALNVIAKVRRIHTLSFYNSRSRCVVFFTGRSSETTFVKAPVSWLGRELPGAGIKDGRRERSGRCSDSPTLPVESLPNVNDSFSTPRKLF